MAERHELDATSDLDRQAERLWAQDLLTRALARLDLACPGDALRLRRAHRIDPPPSSAVFVEPRAVESGSILVPMSLQTSRARLALALDCELRITSRRDAVFAVDRRILQAHVDELFPGLLPAATGG
jgi:hypothetical protein